MVAPTQETIKAKLEAQAEEVAARWRKAIAASCFLPLSRAELDAVFRELYEQCVRALLADPFVVDESRDVGARLVALHCLSPVALGDSLSILGEALAIWQGPEEQAYLQSRLVNFLAEIATGFGIALQQAILREQDHIQTSLSKAREEALRELKESRERFRRLTEATFEGIAIHNQRVIFEVNARMAEMFGYRQDELIGMDPRKLVLPETHEQIRARLAYDPELPHETVGVRKDGTTFPIEVQGRSLAAIRGGRPVRVTSVRSIRARKEMEAELAQARRRLEEARESERMQLAHALHDGPIQDLLVISHKLAALAGSAPAVSATATALRNEVVKQVDTLRALYLRLHPFTADELGARHALRAVVLEAEESFGLAVALSLEGDLEPLPADVLAVLLRAVQEALTNVARHSGVSRAEVGVMQEEGNVTLIVRDEGKGFAPPTPLSRLAHDGHFGLMGIQERIALLEGDFAVEAAPGRGVTIRATLPVAIRRDEKGS